MHERDREENIVFGIAILFDIKNTVNRFIKLTKHITPFIMPPSHFS